MAGDRQLGPNADLIGRPGSRHVLTTPALVLDLDAVERNIGRMARLLQSSGMHLRPHAKTHKCAALARLQIASGAVGICVATLREAEGLAQGGVTGLLVTSPIVGAAKLDRLARLNRDAEGLIVVVDTPEALDGLAAAARQSGRRLDLLVDIDIGMHRTGVATAEDAVALARLIQAREEFGWCGIQGYSGRVQHIEPYAERDRIYSEQLALLGAAATALRESRLEPRIVTGGGTGTLGIDLARGIINEHQAGSYLVMDVEYNAVEILKGETAPPFETAMIMRNSVVSRNAPGFVTIDGGFKCFATDGPSPLLRSGAPEGARYEFFGDEHGRIVFARAGQTLPLGAAVEIVTPHCDPTVNLHDYFHVVRGDTLIDIWPIDARGVL